MENVKSSLLKKVKRTIEEHGLLEVGEGVLVALSGGADSVALLKILLNLALDYQLKIIACHVNHRLRGEEANRDEAFVAKLCSEMGVFLVRRRLGNVRVKSKGESLEEWCRKERYTHLEEVAKEYCLSKIALGHHLQDQAETVLFNLLRGSGFAGLRGMQPLREGKFIRPLLYVKKEEILSFLEAERVPYVTDSTNLDERYTRNRIRHSLIPYLKEYFNPNVEEVLARTAKIMALCDDYLRKEAKEALLKWRNTAYEDGQVISLKEFSSLPIALRFYILKILFDGLVPPGRSIGFKHMEMVITLCDKVEGTKYLSLPGGISVRREYDELIIEKRKRWQSSEDESSSFLYPVTIPGTIYVKEAEMGLSFHLKEEKVFPFPENRKVAFFDYDKLTLPLAIRNAEAGDRIYLRGMGEAKRLKCLFIDEKVPKERRRKIPLLVDRKSILWVVGLRLGVQAVASEKTRRVLQVEIV